jgi:hypothetical protein
MEWKPEAYVAIYAACVSTAALLIQFRNWLASGPRLRCTVTPDGMIISGVPASDERHLVLVNATNIGSADTMITNLCVEERWPPYYFWRRQAIASYVILNPQLIGYPPIVPQLLEPAKTWTGAIRKRPDLIKNIHDGDHYACLYVSTRVRPYRKRIRPRSRAESVG